jgi:hypothetical protein
MIQARRPSAIRRTVLRQPPFRGGVKRYGTCSGLSPRFLGRASPISRNRQACRPRESAGPSEPAAIDQWLKNLGLPLERVGLEGRFEASPQRLLPIVPEFKS